MSFRSFHGLLVILALAAMVTAPSVCAEEKDDPIIAFAKTRLKDPKKPFTLVVIVKVKEGSQEKFEEAFAKALTATRKEKGCLTYDLNHDTKDAQSYVVYERWKSLADLEAHLKTEHIVALLKLLPELTEGQPELRILLPASE
jgi:quinol monooxygenase YgiN